MPHPIKTAIADPDPMTVNDLKNKLKPFPSLNIVAETHNSCEALKAIQNKLPDLIFLNAEMPGKSGFDIIKVVREQVQHTPFVIFITHHPEFTLKALRTGAIDYLQKPIDEAELKDAVERAIELIRRSNQQHKIDHLIDYISKYKQLYFPTATGFKSVNLLDIVSIQKNPDDGKVSVVLGDEEDICLPSNYSLTELFKILPRLDFFQIKREVIVNLKYLSEVEVHSRTCILRKGRYEKRFEMSRRSLQEFKNRMVI